MSNGAECCVLQICCPPEQANAALVKKFMEHGASQDVASSCAGYLQSEFAFAPKSFEAVVQEIVRMAKQHAKNE